MMKLHNITRSLFVALAMCLVGIPAMAEVHLNPFAYRIGNYKATNMVEKSGDLLYNDNFVINYALSGDATSVIVRFWNASSTWTRANGNNGATLLAEIDITNEKDSEGKGCNKKGYHTYTLDFTHVVGLATDQEIETFEDTSLRWTIDVKGGNQSDDVISKTVTITNYTNQANTETSTEQKTYKFIPAQQVSQSWGFRHPSSVDIFTDPYNYNFGVVLCLESQRKDAPSANDDASYISYNANPGLYVFGGGMEHLKARWENNHDITAYLSFCNKSIDFATYPTDTVQNQSAKSPHRVRITDDGKVFISAIAGGGNADPKDDVRPLYKITTPGINDNDNFYEPTASGGQVKEVFTGTWDGTSMAMKTGSSLITAGNVGLDVRGTGSELSLLLLSAKNSQGTNSSGFLIYPGQNQKDWHIHEYKIGNSSTWGTAGTDILAGNNVQNKLAPSASAMLVGFDHVSVEYDPNGGFWLAQYRSINPLAATLAHYNKKTGKFDFEEHVADRNNGGVRHNYNNTKLIVPGGVRNDKFFEHSGNKFKAKQVNENQFTVYTMQYNASTGGFTFTDSAYIDANLRGAKDFAWDFADNLYVVTGSLNKLTAYALPHKNKTASTPSMSQFNFKMSPIYEFNVAVNPTVAEADTYASVVHERIGKAPYPNYLHNALMNLRADVLAGCKFYKWTGQTGTHTTDGNKLVINNLASAQNITAQIGICAYDDTDVLAVKKETKFPAAFVKRDMDNVSYSTICFPFDVATLTDELAGASVLKFTGTTIEKVENGCTHLKLQFEEVTFTGDDIIKAGIPYLIQPKNNITGEFTINRTVTCPTNLDENGYGGKSVTYNGVTFHGLVNGAEFTPDENRLFLVANDRLANLTVTGSINGLRAFFTVSVPSPVICEISLPNKSATSVPEVTTPQDGNVQPTKYMQDGQMFIQQGGQVFNATGAHVK